MFRPPNVPIACFLLLIHVHTDGDDELIFLKSYKMLDYFAVKHYSNTMDELPHHLDNFTKDILVVYTRWEVLQDSISCMYFDRVILYATPWFQYIQHVIKIYNTSVLSKTLLSFLSLYSNSRVLYYWFMLYSMNILIICISKSASNCAIHVKHFRYFAYHNAHPFLSLSSEHITLSNNVIKSS